MSLTGVGLTALGAARVRAAESRRPDALFTDPFADRFLAAAPANALPRGPDDRGVGAVFAVHAALRTRFFDDHLLAAGARQVVLLGAGLDARAFRLAWPHGTRLFEVDLPDLLAFKERVLDGVRPRCLRTVVAADLSDDWPTPLRAAGLDPGRPTDWLAEGLLAYLDHGAADRLLAGVTALSAPGSTLALEHGGGGDLMDRARELPAMAPLAALLRGGLDGDPVDRLTAHGWRATRHDGRHLAHRLGRAVPDNAAGRFVVARRLP